MSIRKNIGLILCGLFLIVGCTGGTGSQQSSSVSGETPNSGEITTDEGTAGEGSSGNGKKKHLFPSSLLPYMLKAVGPVASEGCPFSGISVLKPDQQQTSFSTIQSAIDAAESGDQVIVGDGEFAEILNIENKSNLTVKSECKAQIKGVRFSKSTAITLSGFGINAYGTEKDGILIEGGKNKSDSITLEFLEVKETNRSYRGIFVRSKNTNITIKNSFIHDNGRHGIKIGRAVEPFHIHDNVIASNKKTGIKLGRWNKGTIADNTIIDNGTRRVRNLNGWGIWRVAHPELEQLPQDILLTGNTILANNGRTDVPNSSSDISGINLLIDELDIGNKTSAGTEAAAIEVYVDEQPPQINVGITTPLTVSSSLLSIPVLIEDFAPVQSKVILNGKEVAYSERYAFQATVALEPGNNQIEITSQDSYGMHAQPVQLQVLFEADQGATVPIARCNAGEVYTIKKAGGEVLNTDLQQAIGAAEPGDTVFVGLLDSAQVFQIDAKKEINLITKCHAKVGGFEVVHSENILIDGFKVDGQNTTRTVMIKNKSEFITLANNEILQSANRGVDVHSGSRDIRIHNNYIHHNRKQGVRWTGGGSHSMVNNTIANNDREGISLPKSIEIEISGNKIFDNGTQKPRAGIKQSKNALVENAEKILITGNTFFNNSGKVTASESTQDIERYALIIDSLDVDNRSTTGEEGAGFTAHADSVSPQIEIFLPDTISTNKPSIVVPLKVVDDSTHLTKVFINDVFVYETALQSFSALVTLQNGENTLRVESTDYFGNSSVATKTVTVDGLPPEILQTVPSDLQVLASNSLSVDVMVSSNEELSSASANGHLLNVFGTTASGTITFAEFGPNTIDFSINDLSGNVQTQQIQFELVSEVEPPTITTSIEEDFYTNTSDVNLTVNIADTSSVSTDIELNGNHVVTSSENEIELNLVINPGENLLTINSIDAPGNSSSATRRLVLDTLEPIATLVAPQDGDLLASLRPEIQIQVSDDLAGVSTDFITLEVDGTQVLFEVSLNADLLVLTPNDEITPGERGFEIVLFDRAGNGTGVSFNATVGARAPVLTLTPASGSTIAEARPQIEIQFEGEGLGSPALTVSLDGSDISSLFSISGNQAVGNLTADLSAGSHEISAQMTNSIGQSSNVSSTFEVVPPATQVVIVPEPTPEPVEESSTVTVATGNSVSITDTNSPGYGATANLPPGAIDQDTEISIVVAEESDFPQVNTDEVQFVGPLIKFSPSMTFNKEITMTLPYDKSAVAEARVSEEDLVVYKFDESSNEIQILDPFLVDGERGLVSVLTNGFSTGVVVEPTNQISVQVNHPGNCINYGDRRICQVTDPNTTFFGFASTTIAGEFEITCKYGCELNSFTTTPGANGISYSFGTFLDTTLNSVGLEFRVKAAEDLHYVKNIEFNITLLPEIPNPFIPSTGAHAIVAHGYSSDISVIKVDTGEVVDTIEMTGSNIGAFDLTVINKNREIFMPVFGQNLIRGVRVSDPRVQFDIVTPEPPIKLVKSDDENRIFVTTQSKILVYSTATAELLESVDLGPFAGTFNEANISSSVVRKGKKLYIGAGHNLLIFDTADSSLSHVDISTATGSDELLFDLVASPITERVYIVDSQNPHLYVVDLDTEPHLVQTIHIPGMTLGRSVAVSPDGSEIFVIHGGTEGKITSIDNSTLLVKSELAIGDGPWDIKVTPDGNHLYVGMRTAKKILKVNIADFEIVSEVVPSNASGPLENIEIQFFGAEVDEVFLKDLVEQFSGYGHLCAVIAERAYCWGSNQYGEVGTESTSVLETLPQKVNFLKDQNGEDMAVKEVHPSGQRTCALMVNGRVFCWGEGYGLTGTEMDLGGDIGSKMYARSHNTCVVTAAGGLKCWADSGSVTSLIYGLQPTQIVGLESGVEDVRMSGTAICATHNGVLKCWGRIVKNIDGVDTIVEVAEPFVIPGLPSGVISDFYVNATGLICAVVNSALYCWGSDVYGFIGFEWFENRRSQPMLLDDFQSGVTSIVMEPQNCAVKDGGLLCWGQNSFGQLGDGTLIDRQDPTPVVGLATNVTKVATGGRYTCALADGEFYCWGQNLDGELGIGETEDYVTIPTKVILPTDIELPVEEIIFDDPVAPVSSDVVTEAVIIGSGLTPILMDLQNTDGFWDFDKDYTGERELENKSVRRLLDTVRALRYFEAAIASETNPEEREKLLRSARSALNWVANQDFNNTSLLAHQLDALATFSPLTSQTEFRQLMLSLKAKLEIRFEPAFFGWGSDDHTIVNNLDTAIALSALLRFNKRAAENGVAKVDISKYFETVRKLLKRQFVPELGVNLAGGWGFTKAGHAPDMFITSQVVDALMDFREIDSSDSSIIPANRINEFNALKDFLIISSVESAVSYILKRQREDQSFGSLAETIGILNTLQRVKAASFLSAENASLVDAAIASSFAYVNATDLTMLELGDLLRLEDFSNIDPNKELLVPLEPKITVISPAPHELIISDSDYVDINVTGTLNKKFGRLEVGGEDMLSADGLSFSGLFRLHRGEIPLIVVSGVDEKGKRTTQQVPIEIIYETLDSSSIGSVSGAAYRHYCVAEEGDAKCWGNGSYGALGQGDTQSSSRPLTVKGMGDKKVLKVVAGHSFSCALLEGGEVKCWGGVSLYSNTDQYSILPKKVNFGEGYIVADISGGGWSFCGLLMNGEVKCWGSSQLPGASGRDNFTASLVTGLSGNVSAISVGPSHTCVIDHSDVVCWGVNNFGQIGNRRSSNGREFTRVTRQIYDGAASAIAVGGGHSCAKIDGRVKCWGLNSIGQLGHSSHWSCFSGESSEYDPHTGAIRYIPVYLPCSKEPERVNGIGGAVSKISLGSTHSCAISGQRMACWGGNSYGQLGDGTLISRQNPVFVEGDLYEENVQNIFVKNNYSCARTDSDLKCWGRINGSRVPAEILPVTSIDYSASNRVFSFSAIGNLSNIANLVWNFGDNGNIQIGSNLQNINHEYKAPGQYTVKLTIDYQDGNSSSAEILVVVE